MLYPMPVRTSDAIHSPGQGRLRPVERSVRRTRTRRKVNVVRMMAEIVQSLSALLFVVGVIASVAYLVKSELTDVTSANVSSIAVQYAKVTVASGDTLWALADRYGSRNVDTQTEVNQICAANPALDPNAPLKPGLVLRIPQPATSQQ